MKVNPNIIAAIILGISAIAVALICKDKDRYVFIQPKDSGPFIVFDTQTAKRYSVRDGKRYCSDYVTGESTSCKWRH